jgi:hypothetical protein
LHRWCSSIAVASYDVATEAFGADNEFFAEFTRTEEEDFFHGLDGVYLGARRIAAPMKKSISAN